MPERTTDAEAGTLALREQIGALHEAAYAWSLSCCARDRELAADVLQESYAKVIAGRALFAGRSSFKTWLFGVIRHTAHEQRRRLRWRSVGLGLRLLVPLEDPAGIQQALEARQRSRALDDALAILPDRQREVLHLVFYQELTIAEAATTMGISLGAARQHYHRGKQRLADLLTTDEMGSSHE